MPADGWSAGKLDLGAYLSRIGYSGPVAATEQTLAGLHRAHLAAIPFENLDIMLGRPVRVDLESVQDKLVRGRRGGYCFEHGGLFGAALERIGFSVDRLLAWVVRPEGSALPRTHLTLRVRTPDRLGLWLADVGLGSSPPGPLSLRRLRSGGPQVRDGRVHEVAPDPGPDSGQWQLRELRGSSWTTLYRFDDRPAEPADVEMANHYTSTRPDSWLTRTPVAVIRSPGVVTSLLGRTLTVACPGGVRERRELGDGEWVSSLRETFGLTFTAAESSRLLAAAGRAR